MSVSLFFVLLTFRVLTSPSAFAKTHSIITPPRRASTRRSTRRYESLSDRLSVVDLDRFVPRTGHYSGGGGHDFKRTLQQHSAPHSQ